MYDKSYIATMMMMMVVEDVFEDGKMDICTMNQ